MKVLRKKDGDDLVIVLENQAAQGELGARKIHGEWEVDVADDDNWLQVIAVNKECVHDR
jgi:hypothetical protein